MSESERKNIIIDNVYFECVNTPTFEGLIKKNAFDAVKPRYWLSRALDKIVKEFKHYFENKKNLIEKHAIKYEKDGEKKNAEGQTIQKWKKGDIVKLPNNSIPFEDGNAFLKDLKELQEIKVDLGIYKIQFDEPPDVTIEENMLLLPLLEEKTEFEEKK